MGEDTIGKIRSRDAVDVDCDVPVPTQRNGPHLSVCKEQIYLILQFSTVVMLVMVLMIALMMSWQSVDWDGWGRGSGA